MRVLCLYDKIEPGRTRAFTTVVPKLNGFGQTKLWPPSLLLSPSNMVTSPILVTKKHDEVPHYKKKHTFIEKILVECLRGLNFVRFFTRTYGRSNSFTKCVHVFARNAI